MATLVIFAGLPGVGKTTLCRLLQKKIKCYFFDSDTYAKSSPIFKGVSFDDPEEMQKARLKFYDSKIKEVKRLLKKHEIVVMDAVFDKNNLRDKFYAMIRSIKGKLIVVVVVAPENVIKYRILKDKSKTMPGASPENRLKAYKMMKKGWEPLIREHFIINTDNNTGEQLNKFLNDSNLYAENKKSIQKNL